jgi:hypothetical protein
MQKRLAGAFEMVYDNYNGLRQATPQAVLVPSDENWELTIDQI